MLLSSLIMPTKKVPCDDIKCVPAIKRGHQYIVPKSEAVILGLGKHQGFVRTVEV